MPICKQCGVEVESDYTQCPLCGEVIDKGEQDHPVDQQNRASASGTESETTTAAIEAHDAKMRFLFHEVFGFIALAGAVVVGATDFAYGMDLSWSRIPLISIGYLWLMVFMIPRLKRVPYLLVAGEVLLLEVYLYALNLFTGGPDWYWGIAFPIVAAFGLLILLSVLTIRIFKLSVLGGLAVGFIAAGLFTLCIEGVLNLYFHGRLGFSWSIITAASVIPLIVFMVSFEKRLKKRGSNLEKHFHV